MIKDASSIGLAAELILSAQALMQGLTVLTPLGNFLPYDLIISNGEQHLKVQVKSSSTNKKNGSHSFHTTTGRNGRNAAGKYKKGVAYSAASVDVFAFFLRDTGEWAFLPRKDVKVQRVTVYRNGKYEKYINNWEIFKKGAEL